MLLFFHAAGAYHDSHECTETHHSALHVHPSFKGHAYAPKTSRTEKESVLFVARCETYSYCFYNGSYAKSHEVLYAFLLTFTKDGFLSERIDPKMATERIKRLAGGPLYSTPP